MKVICSVEVVNRSLPSLSITNKKPCRSSLTLGKSRDKEIFLLHQTNGSVRKYKIKDNIANVFVKFVNEGKATIRFKQPEHDLAIKSDPIQLKGFLRTLKLGLDGVVSHQLSMIYTNTVLQNKTLKHIKTKVKISSKEEYPILEGFPRTLETLIINNAHQKSVDNRILRLRNLRVLNIENNCITALPEQLGVSLPNLLELHVANNNLGLTKDWRWIVNRKLQKQLRLLDLRSNKITVLPDRLVGLENVVTLKLDGNNLLHLPNGIGYMKSLRFLSASNNQISHLPGSIINLKLDSLDLSGNIFIRDVQKKLSSTDFNVVPSLVDSAATCILINKLHYTEDNLPRTVIQYLESASFCICGKPCFSTQPESYMRYENNLCRPSIIISSHDCVSTIAVQYCSLQCYSKKVGQSL